MDQFLKDALEARLRMLIPYIEKWPQVKIQIFNVVFSLEWHLCVFLV